MRLLTMKGNGITFDTLGAEYSAKRQMLVFENRPLLDVQFQISGGIAAFSARVTYPVDVNATPPNSLLQSDSVAIYTNAVAGNGVGAGKRRGAEKAPAEARTLLVGPIYKSNRDGRPATKILRKTAQDLKASQNAQAAVQPTTIRYRVKMASDDKGAIGVASKRRPGVPSSVVVVLYRETFQLALKPSARLEPGRTPRNALGTQSIRSQDAKLL